MPHHDLTHISPKRVLMMQLRQIGDVVLSTPCVELVKRKFPQASIDVLTEGKCEEVFYNNPHVNHIWSIDKKALKNPFKALAFYRRIGLGPDRKGYDLMVDFQQLPRCRWVALLGKSRHRLTMEPPWYNRWLYTHWLPPLDGYAGLCKAGVLRPLGIEYDFEKPRLYLSDQEKEQARKLLAGLGLEPGQPLISVDSTHRRSTRRWPAKHWGELLRLTAQARPGLKFYLMYGPGEQDFARQVLETAGPENCLWPESVLPLRQVMAVIGQAALHLGTCSAPKHFAVALDVPSLAVQGSSSKSWTFPGPEHTDAYLGLDCQPCGKETCIFERIKCMTDFKPEDVLPAVLDKLDQLKPQP